MAEPAYYECINPNLVKGLSPISGKFVLEIGCGAGRLGEKMKAEGAACWIGVECVPAIATEARLRLDEVFEGDIETMKLTFEAATFDYIVLGDVLEHLRDPWEVLRRVSDWLTPTGQVVASIPNVNHTTIFAGLLDGRWQYADRGLLDRTHLRFFTVDEIARLFGDAGLVFDSVESCVLSNPGLEALSSDLDLVRRKYGLGSDRFSVESRTWQWLVKASRAA